MLNSQTRISWSSENIGNHQNLMLQFFWLIEIEKWIIYSEYDHKNKMHAHQESLKAYVGTQYTKIMRNKQRVHMNPFP